MSDQRRWKEGVELVLDNRQIFLLFFACSVILSLVFALGVVVGKRVTPGVQSAPTTDPLAVLDQVGGAQAANDDLSFHEELASAKSAPARPAPAVTATATEDESSAPGAAEPRPAAKPAPAAASRAVEPTPQLAAAVVTRPKPAAAPRAAESARRADDGGRERANEAAAEASAAGKFSLQLSSFQDRSEAEAFMQKLNATGMRPFLVPSKIPGRGVWFRVRLGTFETWDEAIAAKETFERKQSSIAYVARN